MREIFSPGVDYLPWVLEQNSGNKAFAGKPPHWQLELAENGQKVEKLSCNGYLTKNTQAENLFNGFYFVSK